MLRSYPLDYDLKLRSPLVVQSIVTGAWGKSRDSSSEPQQELAGGDDGDTGSRGGIGEDKDNQAGGDIDIYPL